MEQTMTTPETLPYQTWDIYRDSSRAARATMDAVVDAVRKVTSPHYGLARDHRDDFREVSFTWHDGAQYRVTMSGAGVLARLYRLQYTGAMIQDDELGPIPDVCWRTVRAFSRDRAGKVLAVALADHPAGPAWREAAAR